jgi:hypothetical protein
MDDCELISTMFYCGLNASKKILTLAIAAAMLNKSAVIHFPNIQKSLAKKHLNLQEADPLRPTLAKCPLPDAGCNLDVITIKEHQIFPNATSGL